MDFRRILSELRRRHVFRVIAGYCAVAFLVVEVANNFFPALQLPVWTQTLVAVLVILGFPIAVVLAWAYDITPEGVRRTDPIRSGRSLAARLLGPWPRWASSLAAIIILLAGGRFIMERRAAGSSSFDLATVAVLPFTVSASPDLEYVGKGIVELLSRDIDGAGKLRAVDPAAVVKAARGLTDESTDGARMAAVARELGAALFVTGSIHEVSGQLRIRAALFDAFDPSRPLRQTSRDGEAAQLFELVDRMATDLLAERRFGATGAELVRTATVTTRSTAALQAYVQGEQAFRVADMEAAAAAFQHAIAEDSAFALAYYRLATVYWWAEPRPGLDRLELYRRSREAAERAAARRNRLGERDARLLDAFIALHRGAPDEAEELYRELLEDYPDDTEAAFQLADLLHHWNALRGRPLAEAREPFERVLSADPEFACPI